VFWRIKWENKFARLIAKGTCTNGGVRLETKHTSAYLGQRWDDSFLLLLLSASSTCTPCSSCTNSTMSSELVLSNYTWDHFSTEQPIIPPKLEGRLRLFWIYVTSLKKNQTYATKLLPRDFRRKFEYKVVVRPKQHDKFSFSICYDFLCNRFSWKNKAFCV